MGREGSTQRTTSTRWSVGTKPTRRTAARTRFRRRRLALPALAAAFFAFALAIGGPLGAFGGIGSDSVLASQPDARPRGRANPYPAYFPAAADESDDQASDAATEDQAAGAETPPVDTALRVWPLAAGTFWFSQWFGCVPQNGFYPTGIGCPPEASGFHDGIDLAAGYGTIIYAAASGTVVAVGDDPPGSGNTWISIQHDGANAGWSTEYYHWQAAYVVPGTYVVAGQPIAEVGSMGYATGAHLHFGVVAWDGTRVDPLTWLPA